MTTTRSLTTMTAETGTDRKRWMALYVLCVGMLMIVLDATIVNVALPSIQDDLGFSQSNLAWVVNAYLIAFGGLLLLAGRVGLAGDARPRALRPGRRRCAHVRRDPRHDRDDVPPAARAGESARRIRVRGLGGRLDRPAGRRRAHRRDQLALDLPDQRADRR